MKTKNRNDELNEKFLKTSLNDDMFDDLIAFIATAGMAMGYLFMVATVIALPIAAAMKFAQWALSW